MLIMNPVLTHSTSPNLLRCDTKNREYLDHYQNDRIHHFRSRRDVSVYLETSEKHLDALEEVHKSVLARPDILSGLKDACVILSHTNLLEIHTERRAPIPAKITLAGENTCQINMRAQISDKYMSLSIPGQHPR